jgi:hypothetical protein
VTDVQAAVAFYIFASAVLLILALVGMWIVLSGRGGK